MLPTLPVMAVPPTTMPVSAAKLPDSAKANTCCRPTLMPAAWAAYDLTTFVQDAGGMVDEALAILEASRQETVAAGAGPAVVPARLLERATTRRAWQA